VNVPVTVIPYGLDTDIWPYTERPERDTFTVVQFGDLTIRKGPFEAVAAFQRAFPTEKDVHLILKTQFGRLGRGGWPIIKDERITLVNETWSRAELVSWLHAADCFIWLSRGEGFGLPPVQAMLTGLPVVLTTNTGMAEYYDPRYFSGVNNAGMSESPLGGEWYEPDVDHAADQLRQVYEHRKTALGKAKRGATWLRNTFSIDAFAGRLDAFLQTL
jgi:glycosyltransferase involved in cell wall biosynthesis